MDSLIVLGLVVVVVLFLLAMFSPRNNKGKASTYELQDALFSPAERSFLGALKLAVGDRAEVFAKVRVADVLKPTRADKNQWRQAFNKISAKHFDFVLCDPSDLAFICAIELDDKSHHQQKRVERDAFLKAACSGAGFPLVQIQARARYRVEELNETLRPLLNKKAATSDVVPQQTSTVKTAG